MADISKIKLPSGSVYEIKDEWARTKIANIDGAVRGGVSYIGKTTTDLHDGSTDLSVTVGGVVLSVRQGDMVSMSVAGKQDIELIFNGTAWNEIGSTGSIKSLAFKDEVSGTTSYTPEGTLTGLAFNGTSFNSSGSYTPAGQITFDSTTDLATTVTTAVSGAVTYTPAGTVSAAFSGTSFNSSGSYTPAGTVTAPAITISTAGSTSTVHNPTAETVVKQLDVYAPSAYQPTGAIAYWEVSDDTLVLKGLMQTTGASITTTDLTVKTGDAEYEAGQPTFNGTSATVNVSGTPTGSITGAEFIGTGVRLTTGTINVPSSPKFSGTEATLSVSGTPTGNVSGGFSGTAKSITITSD